VALLAAAAGLGAPGSAQAATCGSAHGVSVVVDFHQLGGGVQTACDVKGAGRTGDRQLKDVGHTLTWVQRQPGFVCRVDGLPTQDDDPCLNTPPDNAYWSVWWSDGKSGTWSYSSLGVGSLKVPDGGYVALSWQGQDAKALPGVTPEAHASGPSSSPTHRPSRRPTHQPTRRPTSGTASSTTSATASGSPDGSPSSAGPGQPKRSRHPASPASGAAGGPSAPTGSPGTTEAAGVGTTAAPATDDASSGLPPWLPPVLVVALLGAAGTVALLRRRRSGSG